MKRRSLLTAGLAWALPIASANAQSSILVINVNAWNCPVCVTWANESKATWLASPEFKKVRYVEIESPTIKQAYDDAYWRGDLRAIRDQIPNRYRRGTPRFLIVKDEKLISNPGDGWPTIFNNLKTMLATA